MTILNRISAVTLGSLFIAAPLLASAQEVNTTAQTDVEIHQPRTGIVNNLLHRENNAPGDRYELRGHASTSVEGSTTMRAKPVKSDMKNGARLEQRADAGIDARITTLQKLNARVQGAKNVDASTKTSLNSSITAQIASLTSLKANIGNESTTSMRADAKTIRPEYRTYALVLPKTAIIAASDRMTTIAGEMDTIGAKLNTRISAAASSGVNVSAAQSAYADYTSKVADAKIQTSAAASLVANLSADNGDKTIFASNEVALKSAAQKLKIAQADLKAARSDITKITTVVKGTEVHASSTTST